MHVMVSSSRYCAADYSISFANQQFGTAYMGHASMFGTKYFGIDELNTRLNISQVDYKIAVAYPLFAFYPNVTTLRSGLCCRNSVCCL